MNFKIVNITSFSVGIDFYRRVFSVKQKRNGLLILKNILTGATLIDNLNPVIVTIDSKPMENIRQLQSVVWNPNCLCEDDGGDGGNDDFKIFDRTFDRTFE